MATTTIMHSRQLARTAALLRALPTASPARLNQQQQQRLFHVSAVTDARKNKRSGPTSASTVPKTRAVFGEDERDENDEREIEEWFKQMQEQQQQSGKRESRAAAKQGRFGALEEEDDDDDGDDDDDENDPETQEFLSEVDDLFTLEPEEFERKMQTFDKRHPSTRHSVSDDVDDDDVNEDDGDDDASNDGPESYDYDDEDDDDEGIERATERISKKKLLKVLDDLQPGGSSRSDKNAESMALPKTKNSAPLEKKPKKVNVERISYRQERVELSVTDFVQTLILQDSDSNATDVVASIVEASVAPDLRRVVLFWEPQRLNSENQTISKRKVAGIERRLQSQERWIRAQVTRHLNLKYSPNVQFKRRKDAKSDEARAVFDREMAWLNRL